MKLFYHIIILFVLSTSALSQNIDTTIKRWKFNYVEYYNTMGHNMQSKFPNKLLCLGMKTDSIKDGMWVYYYPNGNVLTEGKYKMGRKRGRWIYIDPSGNPVVIRWKKKDIVKDRIAVDYHGQPIMIDDVESKGSKYSLTNGRSINIGGVRWLK